MSFKTSKYASSFSPQNIPGLALWLDAADYSSFTFSSGSNISQWNDKSGNGRNAVGNIGTGTYSTTGLNSRPTVQITSSGNMISSVPAGTFSNGIALFVVFQKTGANNTIDTIVARTVTNVPAPFDFYTRSVDGFTRTHRLVGNVSNTGANEEDITGVARRTSPTIWSVTVYSTSPTTWLEYLNGTPTTYTITGGNSYGDVATTFQIGTRADNFTKMNGNISEIIAYNVSSFSTSQQQQVEAYLAWKWGLAGNLPTAHPYRTAPIFTRPFNPLDVSGCSLWFDADDNRTLTLSGSNVTQWNDKSGNGHTATASGAASPTYSSSSRYLLFNGTSNALALSTGALPSGNSAYSIFIVAYTNNAANPQWILSGGNESSNAALGVFFFTTNAVWHSWWFNEYAVNNSITNGVPSIINVNYTTNRTTITNGGTPTTNNPAATRNNSTGNNFIGRPPNTAAQFLNGGIGEIVIFSREISTGERQQIENYLAEKWNLRSSLSTSNALRLYRALSPVFNPTLIPNCMVWLDAGDSSRFTLTGSNVTTWLDKSGFGCNAVGNSNTGIYSSNGLDGKLPTVQFTPSNTMKVPAPSGTFPTGIAVFMVYQKTGANNTYDMGIARSQGGNARPFDSWTIDGQQTNRFIGGDGGFPSNVETTTNLWRRTTPTVLFMGIFSNTPTTWNESINGAFTTYTTTPTTYADNADGIYIGARSDFTTVMRGNISEIIAYRVPSITTQQRQVVEAYLAKKWNIALPTTHPYYSTPV